MSLKDEGNLRALDPWLYSASDQEKIQNFNVFGKNEEKLKVVETTHCTWVVVGGKLFRNSPEDVMKKIDQIRKSFRMLSIIQYT